MITFTACAKNYWKLQTQSASTPSENWDIGFVIENSNQSSAAQPSFQDETIKQHVHHMLARYQQLGQGEQISMIVDNQQQFGVEIEPFFALYSKMTQGDYAWIAANEQIPFPEKLYFLLQFYYILTFDAERSLRLFENALALQIMPQKHQKELKLLKIIDLYLEANRFAEARTRVLETHEIISQMVVRLGMFRSQRKKYCSTRCPAI